MSSHLEVEKKVIRRYTRIPIIHYYTEFFLFCFFFFPPSKAKPRSRNLPSRLIDDIIDYAVENVLTHKTDSNITVHSILIILTGFGATGCKSLRTLGGKKKHDTVLHKVSETCLR